MKGPETHYDGKRISFFSARFQTLALPHTHEPGFWPSVSALHGDQSFEVEDEKVLETSNENARFWTPKCRNFRPPGIK